MHKPYKYIISAAFFLAVSIKAVAIEIIPKSLDKSAVQLVGKAQFSVLFWDIYQSRLYTATGEYQGVNAPLIFEINYQRDIRKDELIERTIEQWQQLGLLASEYDAYISPLNTLWPDIKQGDTLALRLSNSNSLFYFNDQYLGKIDDPKFAKTFLNIWLSENTSQPRLRKELLGINE